MGLSISYSGEFNPQSSLKEMIDEVVDLCKVYNWRYTIFEDKFPETGFTEFYNDKIYGICFTPPECETVAIEFLSNGKMSSSTYLQFFGNSDREDYKMYLYMISVKTQYSGIEIHAIIIKFFRYLSQKYLLNFELSDDGEYWETDNLKILETKFKLYNNLIDSVSHGIQNFPAYKGESLEDYLLRVMDIIKKSKE